LDAARRECSGDAVRHMQLVFPILTGVQASVVARYGFTADGEGVIRFDQHVRLCEKQDTEVARLRALVRAYFLPPVHPLR